jgi:hypothetical protein
MSTKTGPQKYPGASLHYWYQDDYPGDAMEVNVVVLHTTEGTGIPAYSGGAVAPNLTAQPDIASQKLSWYQHYDFDVSSRALVNLAGGVETNTNNVVQVELIGTCDPKHKTSWGKLKAGVDYIYWPDAPDWALRELAEFLAWAHEKHGVPLSGPAVWKPYPDSYGKDNGVRFSSDHWNDFRGVCGHQHVTENLHGDPGALDFDKLIGFAKELAGTPAAAPKKPIVDLSNSARAFEDYPHHRAVGSVKTVQKALTAEDLYSGAIDGIAGPKSRAAYAKWQRRCGYTSPAAADGIPGHATLTRLGKARGFTVKD